MADPGSKSMASGGVGWAPTHGLSRTRRRPASKRSRALLLPLLVFPLMGSGCSTAVMWSKFDSTSYLGIEAQGLVGAHVFRHDRQAVGDGRSERIASIAVWIRYNNGEIRKRMIEHRIDRDNGDESFVISSSKRGDFDALDAGVRQLPVAGYGIHLEEDFILIEEANTGEEGRLWLGAEFEGRFNFGSFLGRCLLTPLSVSFDLAIIAFPQFLPLQFWLLYEIYPWRFKF